MLWSPLTEYGTLQGQELAGPGFDGSGCEHSGRFLLSSAGPWYGKDGPMKSVKQSRRGRAIARQKARHDRFIALAGPMTEGIPRNTHACGKPMRLAEQESHPLGWNLFCSSCEVFATA